MLIRLADGLTQPIAQRFIRAALGLFQGLIAQLPRPRDRELIEVAQLPFDEVEDAFRDGVFLEELLAALFFRLALTIGAAARFLLGFLLRGRICLVVCWRGSRFRILNGCKEVLAVAQAGGGLRLCEAKAGD